MSELYFVSGVVEGVLSAHKTKSAAEADRKKLVASVVAEDGEDLDAAKARAHVFYSVINYQEALQFTCHNYLNSLASAAE